ncbi:MAG: DUF1097 domain-containing protein [Clostridiales Family XIII bacterium]|jgi:hypothetical protein|nr:DUF1097 domain-containing protein [Clostridiales Family XIII bacterium]
MKKVNGLDVSVAVLAGVSCLGSLFGLPIWALFIGWAWYFAIVASGAVFKTAFPPMIAGSVLAVVAIVLIDQFAAVMPALPAMMLAVLISVFCLMLTVKIPGFGYSLVSFNAYSCMFAGYYAGNFPADLAAGSYWGGLGLAILWITGANFIGLIFGLASIALSKLGAAKQQ